MTASNLIEDVIVQMQAHMEAKGITGKELADRMGVTPGYISHLFRGRKRNLTLTSLAKLAEALGMSVDIFLTADEENIVAEVPVPVPPDDAVRTREVLEAIGADWTPIARQEWADEYAEWKARQEALYSEPATPPCDGGPL